MQSEMAAFIVSKKKRDSSFALYKSNNKWWKLSFM